MRWQTQNFKGDDMKPRHQPSGLASGPPFTLDSTREPAQMLAVWNYWTTCGSAFGPISVGLYRTCYVSSTLG
jgi:hypothetical protein